jgi:hypothetical protein
MEKNALTRLEWLQEDQRVAEFLVKQDMFLPFDYAMLDGETAMQVRAAAGRVRVKDLQTRDNLIDIGRDLIAVKATLKEKLGSGRFGAWLATEFQWDHRTAQRYMNVAERFGDKPDIVSLLPVAATQKLASPSTPVGVREDVGARVKAGEKFTAKAVDLIVKAAKAGQEVAKAKAALTPDQKKALGKRATQRRDEKDRDRRASELREQQQAELAMAGLDLIRQKFGPSVGELAPYLEVWGEVGRLLRGAVIQPLDESGLTHGGHRDSHDVTDHSLGGSVSLLAGAAAAPATAVVQP